MSRAQDVLARMKGPVVPLNLCFNVDGTPDYPSIARYVDWLADEGVPILMLTAGSSEFASLSDDEIWRLTAVVAEANQGRALFIASSGLWKPSVTREFLVHADRVGADAVKLQFSSWLTLRRDVLVRYFDLVQDAADVPLLLLSGATSRSTEPSSWPRGPTWSASRTTGIRSTTTTSCFAALPIRTSA